MHMNKPHAEEIPHHYPATDPARAERLALAAAALRGILTGATRALLDAILNHHLH
jgi:hypothetical protein